MVRYLCRTQSHYPNHKSSIQGAHRTFIDIFLTEISFQASKLIVGGTSIYMVPARHPAAAWVDNRIGVKISYCSQSYHRYLNPNHHELCVATTGYCHSTDHRLAGKRITSNVGFLTNALKAGDGFIKSRGLRSLIFKTWRLHFRTGMNRKNVWPRQQFLIPRIGWSCNPFTTNHPKIKWDPLHKSLTSSQRITKILILGVIPRLNVCFLSASLGFMIFVPVSSETA